MDKTFIISLLISLAIVFILIRMNLKRIRKYLSVLSVRLHIRSLRNAINGADKDKDDTGRKNIVVYNTAINAFEPVQKKMLKKLANKKVQDKVPAGYRQQKAKKKTYLTTHKVKQVEEKSLYVTK